MFHSLLPCNVVFRCDAMFALIQLKRNMSLNTSRIEIVENV